MTDDIPRGGAFESDTRWLKSYRSQAAWWMQKDLLGEVLALPTRMLEKPVIKTALRLQ